MANITEYLKNIMSARFGREVRGSIHDAIAAINEESTNAATSAAQAASAAKNAVNATGAATESANTAAASANEAAEKANAAASGDLSEKTTTYTESTTESPPASGSKLPAIIGWCIGKIKTLVQGNEMLMSLVASKQDKITGSASTIATTNLTPSRALAINSDGKVAVSNTTSLELSYLGGVTSKVQTQIDKKIEYTTGQYATLAEFVESVEAHGSPGLVMAGRWKDTTGVWTPNGTGGWYRGFVCLQNVPSSGSDIGGFVVCQRASNFSTYCGYISGTKTSGYKATWSRLATLLPNSQFANEEKQQLYIAASDETGYRAFLGVKGGSWMYCPETSKNLMLGGPNNLWGDMYSGNAVIQTSDRNVKKDIQALTEQHLKFFRMLQPVSFAFIDGTSGRTHVGFISQDVEQAMTACGLTDLDFAGFCKDQKYETVEKEVDGEIVYEDVPIEGEYVYSLRYNEFMGIIAYAVQCLYNEVESLRMDIKLIQERIGII